MDTRELKELLKGSATVLLLNDGKPDFVVLNYDVYRELIKNTEREVRVVNAPGRDVRNGQYPVPPMMEKVGTSVEMDRRETELIERLNREINALKNQVETQERGVFGSSAENIAESGHTQGDN